jgi:hypothetical protein
MCIVRGSLAKLQLMSRPVGLAKTTAAPVAITYARHSQLEPSVNLKLQDPTTLK